MDDGGAERAGGRKERPRLFGTNRHTAQLRDGVANSLAATCKRRLRALAQLGLCFPAELAELGLLRRDLRAKVRHHLTLRGRELRLAVFLHALDAGDRGLRAVSERARCRFVNRAQLLEHGSQLGADLRRGLLGLLHERLSDLACLGLELWRKLGGAIRDRARGFRREVVRRLGLTLPELGGVALGGRRFYLADAARAFFHGGAPRCQVGGPRATR